MSKLNFSRAAAVLALGLVAGGASASVPADDNWLAWLGCWQAEGANPRPVVCFIPDGNGVRIMNYTNNVLESEARIFADGQERSVNQEGCSGVEKAAWSKDGRRLFLKSEQTCGERTRRTVTGLMTMLASYEFVNVQSVTSGENTGVRTFRYRAMSEADAPAVVQAALRDNRLARQTARTAAAGVIDLSDVAEAAKNVHTQVVESWITAAGQEFDLNGKALVKLADAGVERSLIDVLVAVSYPDRFAVGSEDEIEEISTRRVRGGYGGYERSCYDDYWDRAWFDPYGFNYASRYGRGYYGYDGCRRYGYGIGHYGLSPWGYDPYGWRYNNPVVVVIRDANGEIEQPRATRQGYTRKPVSGTASGSNSSGRSSSASPSRSSGTTGSSSSGSSTSGSSTSSGSSTTTRTAKPRGSGN